MLIQSESKEYLSQNPLSVSGFDKDFTKINKIYEYVFKHIHEEIKLNDVSDLLNMAPGSFCRFFKKKNTIDFYGICDKNTNGLRCKKCSPKTNKQITQIAYDCGYNNLANFNHYFKKTMQKTPSEYRKDFK